MATIQLSGKTLNIPDEVLASYRARVQNGEDPNQVALSYFQDAQNHLQSNTNQQGGYNPAALQKYGLASDNEANLIFGARDKTDTQVQGLASILQNKAQPQQFAPGSLIEGSSNSVTKEWPVQVANKPYIFPGINPNDPAEIAYRQRLANMPRGLSYDSAGAPATPIASQTSPGNNLLGSVQNIQRSLSSLGNQVGFNTQLDPNMQIPGNTQGGGSNSNPESALLAELEKNLQDLQRRGQVLNPNVEIDASKAAEFLSQAEKEINPYYTSQIKLAKESLLASVGEAKDNLLRDEQRAERKYGQDLRTLGENSAEAGFAQSGQRMRNEDDLAYNTENTLYDARNSLSSKVGDISRTFAQKYGSNELPSFDIPNAPQIGRGLSSFNRSNGTQPLYQLSPDVYNGLIGSDEFARRGAVQSRASELEGTYRGNQAINQARTLTL